MTIYSAEQIKKWDKWTIEEQEISSLALMERAAKAFCNRFQKLFPDKSKKIAIYCGPGNNGGDGLAIGRLLYQEGYQLSMVCCEISPKKTEDYLLNLKAVEALKGISLIKLEKEASFSGLPEKAVIIDALFGTGLNRPVVGYWANLISCLNERKQKRVAVDIPSGLFADELIRGEAIKADYTISFQIPKLSFLFKEHADYVGDFYIESIGLASNFHKQEFSPYLYIDLNYVQSHYKKRPKFSHKGNFGHALLIAGSYGMFGAAQLVAMACLKSGIGLLSLHVPSTAFELMQSNVKEAMISVDLDTKYFSKLPSLQKYKVIGIGPGLNQKFRTYKAFKKLLHLTKVPMVIDADALNLLAKDAKLLEQVPQNSILTPHPGEFKRLFGDSPDSLHQIKRLKEVAQKYQLTIVLKGAYTRIASPDGQIFFNSTGNPGMAGAGSGDVLTGIITALLGQGYSSLESAILGVYLHGKAGDFAAKKLTFEGMIASDIIDHLVYAFKELNQKI